MEREADPLEPLDFGAERGSIEWHKLEVISVTPRQWAGIEAGQIALAEGWSPDGTVLLAGKPVPA